MVTEKERNAELLVDKYDLDEECCKQPQLYYKWAKEAAILSKSKYMAEAHLNRVRARADHDVRKNPGAFDLEDHPKEKAIAGAVSLQEEFREAEEAYLEAKRAASLAAANEKAFEQRKQMIKVLGDLFVHEYYSTPTIKKAEEHEYRKDVGKKRRLRGK